VVLVGRGVVHAKEVAKTYDQVWPVARVGGVLACDEPSQASIGAAVWLRPGLAVQALAVLVC
jgi:hypothetical protein